MATTPRSELRDFLRTRRARLTPADVDLPAAGRRRTPGLRREEVAALAGVGISWYTWLEQGRPVNASPAVLDAIGAALRLDAAERAHLYLLTGANPPLPEPDSSGVRPELRRLVRGWSPRPAILRDRYWNLLAVNDASRAAFGYDETARNCLLAFFTHARYRQAHDAWASAAPGVVAAFRADAAHAPGDPGFRAVIAELESRSPDFAELWARHDVAAPVQAVKEVRHPELGALTFDTTTLAVVDRPGQFLELYDPRPGTPTAQRMGLLRAGHSVVSADP